ncbi:DUF3889 domain-containing protein [Thalassobacillus sp. CUG 92003]|uniref:DUF3889 domain-containing protein n=1 Tax=Thalassobacillus sp. CUG 92003 TaxID=2736641 RepID=UPI0015E67AC8|nr:DUF3889 domain-containing protein [Thalassobacillus sp. CUG 92003]
MRSLHLMVRVTLLWSLLFLVLPANNGLAQPEYAKWGKIAVEETAKQYPDLKLVEYEYDGKVFISDERAQFDFEFQLEDNQGQKSEIRTYVLVNQKTNQLIDVYFDEIHPLN